jgi:hypothetical protein
MNLTLSVTLMVNVPSSVYFASQTAPKCPVYQARTGSSAVT